MSLVTFVEALFVGAVAAAFAFAVLWCLVDVALRARELPASRRVAWGLTLVLLNVPAAVFYVVLGPGRRRWRFWVPVPERGEEELPEEG